MANPSTAGATVTVQIPSLGGMEAFNLDKKGQRTGAATVTKSGKDSLAVQLGAVSKVEFAPQGAMSQFDYRQAMLRKRQADQEAALAKAREDCIARTKISDAEAKANPAPANTVLVVAGAGVERAGRR